MKFPKRRELRTFILFIAIMLLYIHLIEPLLLGSPIAKGLQVSEAGAVASLQSSWNTNVSVSADKIYYPDIDHTLLVGPLCVGIREIFIFSIMVLVLGICALKTKLISLAIFIPIILIENIIRLLLLYPVAVEHGIKAMEDSHNAMWTFWQIIFVLLLFVLWFFLFNKPQKDKSRKKNQENGKQV